MHVFSVCNLCEISRITQWCFELNIKVYIPYRPVIFLMSQWLKKVRLLEFFKMCFSHNFNHDRVHFPNYQNGVGCLCFGGAIYWFRSNFFNGVVVVVCSGSTLKKNYYWYFVARNDLKGNWGQNFSPAFCIILLNLWRYNLLQQSFTAFWTFLLKLWRYEV